MKPSQRSVAYSKRIKSDLFKYFQKHLSLSDNDVCIAITGSFAKDQGAPDSDVDLIVIFDDRVDFKCMKHKFIREINTPFSHQLEIYPVLTSSQWLKVAKNSTLYASDLFFARPIWGNYSLLFDLMDFFHNNLDLENQISYFTYNLLYRDLQFIQYRDSNDIKYQPGGLRDMQLIKWISYRLTNCPHCDPSTFLSSLVQAKLVTTNQYALLCDYFESIADLKWHICSKNYDHEEYEQLRKKVIPIMEQIKRVVLDNFAKRMGSRWKRVVNLSRTRSLDDAKTILNQDNQSESMIFCATWSTSNPELLYKVSTQWYRYWTVRMALAVNPCTPDIVKQQLQNDSSEENSDIRKILKRKNNNDKKTNC